MAGVDPDVPVASEPTWKRLEDQLGWYDRKSVSAQRLYKRLKVLELIVAAMVPVVAGAMAPAAVTAGLAAVVVVLEAVQHLFQWQADWVRYRSVAESLKHEKFLFLAQAGPYSSGARLPVLAERIEGLVSQEHAQWTQERQPSDMPTSR